MAKITRIELKQCALPWRTNDQCKVILMAKKFECPECGDVLKADRQTRLVEMVQSHAEDEHSMELDEEDIREGIEDT